MNIVVAFNQSDDALAAVAWGAEIARHSGAEIHLVHAVPNPIVPTHAAAKLVEDLMAAATETAQQVVDSTVADLRGKKLKAHGHVRRWLAVEAIIDAAALHKAGLIVMGRRGSSRATELLIGTISSEVVRLAHTSVMIVPRRALPGPGGRVLVAVDGSPPSVRALAVARKAFPDAAIVAAHVQNPLSGPADVGAAIKAAGIDGNVEAKILKGDPATELLAEAEGGRYQAIVLGPRGFGLVKGLLLGSVSEKVLHLAKIPIVIAR